MAGVWSSDDPIPNRAWFHNVTNDGIGGASVAMNSLRRSMDRAGRGLSTRDGLNIRRRRAEEDLRDMQLNVGPPSRPQRSQIQPLWGHRGVDGPHKASSRNWDVHPDDHEFHFGSRRRALSEPRPSPEPTITGGIGISSAACFSHIVDRIRLR